MMGFLSTKWLLCFTVCYMVSVTGAHWSYKEQTVWPGVCTYGRHQSPINLQKDTADHRVFTDFQFKNYNKKYMASITNNGHSVALRLLNALPRPAIKGAGLPHEYVLDHLHFHWESEHTLHSNRFPLELHLVHYASIFNSTGSALTYKAGLAVIGILFDISEEDNPAFEPMLAKLKGVQDMRNAPVQLEEDVSVESFLPKDIDTFFRYEGSLTTPGCDEVVVWTVLYQINHISKRQFAFFPTIRTPEGHLEANYRDLQKLNDRVITFRSLNGVSSTLTSSIHITNLLTVTLITYYIQRLIL